MSSRLRCWSVGSGEESTIDQRGISGAPIASSRAGWGVMVYPHSKKLFWASKIFLKSFKAKSGNFAVR